MSIPDAVVLPMGDADAKSFESFEASKYWKEVIRCGKWVHPQTGEELDVDVDRLKRWRDAFYAMKNDGVEVYQPDGHTREAAKNLGDTHEMEIRGDALYALMNFPDPEVDKKIGVTIKHVSPLILKNLQGTTGKSDLKDYGEAIEHIACTPVPVQPNQENFLIAAANENEQDIMLFALSKLTGDLPTGDDGDAARSRQEKEKAATEKRNVALSSDTKEKNMDFKELAKLLGYDGELTEENCIEIVKTKLDGLGTENQTAMTRADTADSDLVKANDRIAELEKGQQRDGELAALEKHPAFLAMRAETDALKADTMEDSFGVLNERVAALSKTGRITDEIKTALSESMPTAFDKDSFDEMAFAALRAKVEAYEAMPENAAIPFGDLTADKLVELARTQEASAEDKAGDERKKTEELADSSLDEFGGGSVAADKK